MNSHLIFIFRSFLSIFFLASFICVSANEPLDLVGKKTDLVGELQSGTHNYFLHPLSYLDLSDQFADNHNYCHSMVEIDGKIYIARNASSDTKGTIDVYEAVTLKKLPSLTIDTNDLEYYAYTGNILLGKDDNNHLIVLFEPIPVGTSINVKFGYFSTEDGKLINSFEKSNLTISGGIHTLSAPIIVGDVTEDTFTFYLAIVNDIKNISGNSTTSCVSELRYSTSNPSFGHTLLKINNFLNYVNNSSTKYFVNTLTSLSNGYFIMTNNSHDLQLCFFNNEFYKHNGAINIDKNSPSTYDLFSNGVTAFEYDNKPLVIYGAQNNSENITLKLGMFVDNMPTSSIEDIKNYAPSDNAINALFEIYNNTSLTGGATSRSDNFSNPFLSDNNKVPFQLSAVHDYDLSEGNVAIINTYVPGVALASYQLNQNSVTTDIENIIETPRNDLSVRLDGKQLLLSYSVDKITVCNLMGITVAKGHNCDSIDLSDVTAGVYIVYSGKSVFKIVVR